MNYRIITMKYAYSWTDGKNSSHSVTLTTYGQYPEI